jgi:protein-disulfide isomerase
MANLVPSGRVSRVLDAAASLATIVAAIAVVATVGMNWRRLTTKPTVMPPPASRSAATKVEGLETIATTLTKHNPGAKLAIVEFSDFQCPFCGQYAREVYPKVQQEFVDTGIADYVFRHFPLEQLHPLALKAGEAVECARQQGKPWEMHDKLFANQEQLKEEGLMATATALGLNKATFRTCLDGQAEARIREDEAEGRRLGVVSTPTFMIGLIKPDGKITLVKKFSGAQPFETIRANINSVLGG